MTTNVLVYNSSWATRGGGEKYVLSIADVLAESGRFAVTLLIDRSETRIEDLRNYFNLRLQRVGVVHCAPGRVRTRLRECDLAVIQSNFRSYGLPARETVYIMQVPYGAITAGTILRTALTGSLAAAVKDGLRAQLLRTAQAATMTLANSRFTADALLRHHSITAQVLYPPIDTVVSAQTKRPIILSVGRFFRGIYNDKRYDVLIKAFRLLRQQLPRSFTCEYHIAGSCGADPASRQYLEWLQAQASGCPIYFHPNLPYRELQGLYAEATVFWHAAGYAVDEMHYPERAEHFGMATVEAMTAGCIPVVIARGGQKEIVNHGKSGYLWNTVDELVTMTLPLLFSTNLQQQLAEGARQRSHDFSRDRFSERCLTLFNSSRKVE